jgi:hypothetical protein
MPGVGFEPTIAVFERENTLHASDRAATVIGFIHKVRFTELQFLHQCAALTQKSSLSTSNILKTIALDVRSCSLVEL